MIDVREHTTKVEQEAARVAAGSPVPTTGPSFPLPTLPLTHTHTHTRTVPGLCLSLSLGESIGVYLTGSPHL
jgi:hypothetical protein